VSAGSSREDVGLTAAADLVAESGSLACDVVEQDAATGAKLRRGAEMRIEMALLRLHAPAHRRDAATVSGLRQTLTLLLLCVPS
jgi:hypothetical protein